MAKVTRRTLLGAPALFRVGRAAMSTDIRIRDVRIAYQDYLYRTPYMFGGRKVDRVTLLNVDCTVRTAGGRDARGIGSMTLGNLWSFPSRTMGYDTTLNAMKALAARLAALTGGYPDAGHPVEINSALQPAYLKAAAEVSRELKLDQPIPKLCVLVTASAFDAAILDAYGKVHGRSAYNLLGPEFLGGDLSRWLGPSFRGAHLDRFVRPKPNPRTFLYHSVGASDPITAGDIAKRIGDGLPETLPEWIRRDGLSHLKLKLNGNNLEADLDRVVKIDRVTAETQRERGVSQWAYCLDFNEQCPNVEYLLEFLRRLREQTPSGYDKIQYVEQPTARDLAANRSNVMHKAARLRPVVIDESLTDLDALMLAREMGYTGAALKACKQISQELLLGAAAQRHRMFLCVQDLTCPGLSFLESAGLAARVPGVSAMEANAREYVPAANRPFEKRFPGLFHITGGTLATSELTGPGLGA